MVQWKKRKKIKITLIILINFNKYFSSFFGYFLIETQDKNKGIFIAVSYTTSSSLTLEITT